MPNFTPGDWEYKPKADSSPQFVYASPKTSLANPRIIEICRVRDPADIQVLEVGETCVDELGDIHANGRLIAAAPKMFNLLLRLSLATPREIENSGCNLLYEAVDLIASIDAGQDIRDIQSERERERGWEQK